MYHSITFGTKNTWDDWHLISSGKPTVSMPSVKSKFEDLPSGMGQADLTEIFGTICYGDRQGEFNFLADPDYMKVEDQVRIITNYIHGKRMQIILEDDPDYYYIGRFNVSKVQSGKSYSQIDISYTLGPFKYPLAGGEGVL